MEEMDCEEFGEFLLSKGINSDVISAIISHRVCGELFVSLSDDELKEIAPSIGDRIRLRKVLTEARKVERKLHLLFYPIFFIFRVASNK